MSKKLKLSQRSFTPALTGWHYNSWRSLIMISQQLTSLFRAFSRRELHL